jgi:hypothetical protein
VNSASERTKAGERCPERERLLRDWTACVRQMAKLLEEHPATMKSSESNLAGFAEQIRLARAAEVEACRKYYRHVNTHDCV